MQYALLIYSAGADRSSRRRGPMAAEIEGYDAFTAHLRERGAYAGRRGARADATATTVRVRDGKTLTTDGPFAETKEALGGFYLVEAADLDEAIALRRDDPGRAARLDRGPADLRRAVGRRRRALARRPVRRGPPAAGSRAAVAAHEVVDRLFREEQGRAVATLIRVLGDFDLAEEAVQDAFIAALETWPARGRAGQPGRLDHDDGAQPGDRPAPPAQAG